MPLNLVFCLIIVQSGISNCSNLQERVDTWEDDSSVSESSSIYRPDLRFKEFNNPHYNDEDSRSNPDD